MRWRSSKGSFSRCHGVGILLAVATVLAAAAPAPAVDDAAKLKAVMVTKVLRFDRALAGKGVKVLVCGKDARNYAAIFTQLGVANQVVPANELADAVASASVVYFLDPSVPAGAQAIVADAKLLSVGNHASLAEAGAVTVAIDTSEGKAEIVVNLERAKTEGRDLAAALLKLARVVK